MDENSLDFFAEGENSLVFPPLHIPIVTKGTEMIRKKSLWKWPAAHIYQTLAKVKDKTKIRGLAVWQGALEFTIGSVLVTLMHDQICSTTQQSLGL